MISMFDIKEQSAECAVEADNQERARKICCEQNMKVFT